jgi:hypothetical protein
MREGIAGCLPRLSPYPIFAAWKSSVKVESGDLAARMKPHPIASIGNLSKARQRAPAVARASTTQGRKPKRAHKYPRFRTVLGSKRRPALSSATAMPAARILMFQALGRP